MNEQEYRTDDKTTKGSDVNFGTQIRHTVGCTELNVPFEEHESGPAGRRWVTLLQSHKVRDALKHGPLALQACRA
jgi:hypothetical protein